MTRVWIVQAEHPSVPGTKIAAFTSPEAANRQAAEWTNAVLGRQHTAPASWRAAWRRGKEWVWIEEVGLQP